MVTRALSRCMNSKDMRAAIRQELRITSASRLAEIVQRVREGETFTFDIITPKHRCVQRFTYTFIPRKSCRREFRESVENHYFTAQDWPEPRPAGKCSPIYNKSMPRYVIKPGAPRATLMHWVGIGWIEDRAASEADFYAWPVVVDGDGP